MARIRSPHELARALVAIAALLGPGAAWAAKTDVLQLRNGDRITGEIKSLAYGQLQYSTDDMGTLYIEWDNIVFLKSSQLLQVELLDGARLTGQAVEPESRTAGFLVLQEDPGAQPPPPPRQIRMDEIARIETLETGTWWERVEGSVSVGYSFAQSTGVEVMNFRGSLYSRKEQLAWRIDLDSQITDDEDSPSSKRGSLIGELERHHRERNYLGSNLEFSRNEELGLELRSLLGVSWGRYLSQTQNLRWRAGAGLAGSREDYGPEDMRTSLELQLATEVRLFRFDTPEKDIDLDLAVLPSLSDWGRVRGELSLDLRYEIVKDFFFEISVYESYDNQPAEDASHNDWGVTTSLGYKF